MSRNAEMDARLRLPSHEHERLVRATMDVVVVRLAELIPGVTAELLRSLFDAQVKGDEFAHVAQGVAIELESGVAAIRLTPPGPGVATGGRPGRPRHVVATWPAGSRRPADTEIAIRRTRLPRVIARALPRAFRDPSRVAHRLDRAVNAAREAHLHKVCLRGGDATRIGWVLVTVDRRP